MRAIPRFRAMLTAALILIASVAIPVLTSGTAEAATCNTTAKSSWANNCTTSDGAHSNYVVAIQTIVEIYDQDLCGPLIAIDGYFGSDTVSAVECWQSGHGLSVDGVVGPKTWTSLESALAYYDTVGAYKYYISQDEVDFRETTSTGVWAYGGPYTGSPWTNLNTSTPPVPISVGCCD